MERELTRRGFSAQNVLTVEPYFGDRETAIAGEVQDAQRSVTIAMGVTALFTLLAVWRFVRWRNRRAAKLARRATKTHQPIMPQDLEAPVQTQAPSRPAKPSNPWGGAQQQSPKQSPISAASPMRTPAPEPDLPIEYSTFQSVFSGGGSGFRFKTSDEIVRENFGTLTRITASNADS